MKTIGLLLSLAMFMLIGCGGSGNGMSMQTVQAQSPTYSATNFSGTYNAEFAGTDKSGGTESGSAVLTANGAGLITGGSYTIHDSFFGTTPCSGSLSGSYSISSNGTGTATLNATADATSAANGCDTPLTLHLVLAVSADGNTVVFSEADIVQVIAGAAIK